jgi:GT2 family glycosyltransferase
MIENDIKMKNIENSTIPLVSIIILNYNAGNLLIDCVDSIQKTNHGNYEIIIVDNDSTDKSYLQCCKKFPEIILIENKENLGYCGGNNVGIQKAKGEYIIILNPDTIVDPNWVKELILAYEKYGDGLYQPKFLTTTDHQTIMSTGNMIHLFGFGFSRGKGEFDYGKFNEHEIIGYASGTCLFSKSEIFNKLNSFDPFLFAYHDDLDLCWRAALVDIPSHYAPKSIVYHPSEGFAFKWSNFKFYLLERNRQYCILTHYSRSTFYKLLPSLLLVEIFIFIFYLKKGMLSSKIKANWNIMKNWKHINEKYNEIQKFRTISDKILVKSFNDEMYVPKVISTEFYNNIFNNFIKKLSIFAKKFI